ncbi:FTR1 family iron permease [Viridibacillus arvi]|uniref:FTR1 family iron permease n=1 Tax=Viridibacillus arvi TaxID=263475 RepID=UPI00187B155D|nr:FTR1 family protein [Viridibacillus sp. JNUCC-6]QOV09603.1 FTR1 family iron permease [Viridibacillus sp. JNUCC-6]
MKHFLKRCSQITIILGLIILTSIHSVNAAASYSHLYISISDAIMNSKQDQDKAAIDAIKTFQSDWIKADVKTSSETKTIESSLDEALNASSKEDRLTALTKLSKALTALEKAENPVDEMAERAGFLKTITPALNSLGQTIQTGDLEKIEVQYKQFNTFWKRTERPVREHDIASYGQIETQMSFMRMTLADDNPNIDSLTDQFNSLKQAIDNFAAGKKTATQSGTYSLQTLLDLIDEAKDQIDDEEYSKASATIKKFITTWPNVEGDIRTKNASLYTKIESDMPIIASNLMKDSIDAKDITSQLNNFKQQIQLIQGDQNYSFWDAALILLREGLEALLIIIALVAFLKKSGQTHMERWIYIGAGIGIGLSALAAILMSTLFNSTTINTSREMLEGYIGLAAAAMMIGVGVWMHSKSNIKSWNNYISKQMNHAMSKQSVWAMAFISFLSVFREGAETLVFYAGIAPKMSTFDFTLGIGIALAILMIVAIVLLRASGRIPIHYFFAVATVLIYLLAFKIIGVSIHTLQLTNVLPTSIISNLPVWASIGFYPTIETIIGQVILIVLVIITFFYKRHNENVTG